MTYTVKTYEFFEWNSDPDVPCRYIEVGTYETAQEAILACKHVINTQISQLRREGNNLQHAVSTFDWYGETPVIFGEPAVKFDVAAYLKTLNVMLIV